MAAAQGAFADAFFLDSTGRFVVFGSSSNDIVAGGVNPSGVGLGYARDTCLQFGTNPGAVPNCTPRSVLVSVDSQGNLIETSVLNISGDAHFVVFLINLTNSTDPGQIAIGRTSF